MFVSLKFKSIGVAVLSALSLSLTTHAAEVDPEKAMAVSNYVLGIEPSARGNKFELLKTSPLGSGNAATAGGFFGTALSGVNPFSSAGVHSAGGISLALDALSLLSKKEVKEPLYDEGKIHGNLFGKYYLLESASDEFDAKKKIAADIKAKVNAASMEVFNTPMEVGVEKFSELQSVNGVIMYVKNNEDVNFGITLMLGGLERSKIDETKEKLLNGSPSYENKKPFNFQLCLLKYDIEKGKYVNTREGINELLHGEALKVWIFERFKMNEQHYVYSFFRTEQVSFKRFTLNELMQVDRWIFEAESQYGQTTNS